MKLSKEVLLALTVGSTMAFTPLAPSRSFKAAQQHLRQSSSAATEAEIEEAERKDSKKNDRLRMMKSPNFHRRGFKEVRDDAEKRLADQYMSNLVKDLRSNNYMMERDGVKVYLAKVRTTNYVLS